MQLQSVLTTQQFYAISRFSTYQRRLHCQRLLSLIALRLFPAQDNDYLPNAVRYSTASTSTADKTGYRGVTKRMSYACQF